MINAQFLNRDWESVFSTWGAPPSATEQTKCENAALEATVSGWLVCQMTVIEGTWRAELRSNWKNANDAAIPPIHGYMVIRQTFLNLSLRLLTAESSSHLVGTEIVCSDDGLYCVSGVYRNEPSYQNRGRSPIH